MSEPITEQHLTVQQVSRRLNVSVGKVHQLIADRDLPAVNIGRGSKAYWRISPEDFTAYLADQRAKTAARFNKKSA